MIVGGSIVLLGTSTDGRLDCWDGLDGMSLELSPVLGSSGLRILNVFNASASPARDFDVSRDNPSLLLVEALSDGRGRCVGSDTDRGDPGLRPCGSSFFVPSVPSCWA